MTQNQTNNERFTIQKSETPVSQNSQNIRKNFVILKKIAKHGRQSIIVIPRMLEEHLKPGTIVQLGIDVLQENPIKDLREEGK